MATKKESKYYVGSYTGLFFNLALKKMNEDTSFEHRQRIAKANGLENYLALGIQDKYLIDLLNAGKLVKVS